MRLIDADKLIYKLNNELGWEETRRLQTMIMEQPTAYDVDKVVEELKKHKNNEKMTTTKTFNGLHRYYRAISVTKAVRIVKGGGIDDE